MVSISVLVIIDVVASICVIVTKKVGVNHISLKSVTEKQCCQKCFEDFIAMNEDIKKTQSGTFNITCSQENIIL